MRYKGMKYTAEMSLADFKPTLFGTKVFIALLMMILCPLKPLMSLLGPQFSLYHTSVISAPLIAVFYFILELSFSVL
jgi:hypothetical protein